VVERLQCFEIKTCSNENCSSEYIILMAVFKTAMSDTDSSFEDRENDSDVEVK